MAGIGSELPGRGLEQAKSGLESERKGSEPAGKTSTAWRGIELEGPQSQRGGPQSGKRKIERKKKKDNGAFLEYGGTIGHCSLRSRRSKLIVRATV